MDKVKEKGEFSFKDFILGTRFSFKILFKISKFRAIFLLVAKIFSSIEGYLYAIIFGFIIDAVIIEVSSIEPDISNVVPYIWGLLIYAVFTSILFTLERYCYRYINFHMRGSIMLLLADKCEELGVKNLEDPENVNLYAVAKDWFSDTNAYFYMVVDLIAYLIAFLLTGFAVFQFTTWIPFLIVAVVILQFYPKKYFRKRNFNWQVDHTENRRKAYYDFDSIITPATLKEISILGAYGFLSNRYSKFYDYYVKGFLEIYTKQITFENSVSAVQLAIVIFGYYLVIGDAIEGIITIGALTVAFQAIRIFNQSLTSLFDSITNISDYGIKIVEVKKFFDLEPEKDGNIELPRFQEPPSVSIQNVTFKYPSSRKNVLKELNIDIKAGEKIAIVGHNGAGKTTLISLIARLYRPTKGNILINEHNLNDIKLDDWYKNLGVLFQDYNFYEHLTAEENIYIGRSVKPLDRKKLIKSAKMSDSHKFISEYKNGYSEIMSERYKNGTRPSSGQKQKISIARFFYRNAPLVIFDEPTAAIDAVSEYNIFNEIYNFFKDKTVIVVSHRFSTVRNADRILVMEDGRIIEQGNHSELLKLGGKYAEAFRLQAEGYSSEER